MDPEKDVEASPVVMEDAPKPSSLTRDLLLSEAGALLLLWSILVINEGAIRFVNVGPGVPGFSFDGDLSPENGFRFMASLFEVFFGIMGVFLGISAFLFKFQNTSITKICMIVQALMGYFVFIIYVFAIPAFQAKNLPDSSSLTLTPEQKLALTVGGKLLNTGQVRFFITLGILTSVHWCFALQGGQFVFMARVITGGTGEDFLMQKSGARMRAIFWNGNLAFSGLWTLISGAFLLNIVGGGKLPGPFVSPPNVGRYPAATLFTGVLVLLWGLAGVALAAVNMKVPVIYYFITGVVYVWGLLNWGIFQLTSFFPGGITGGAPFPLAGPVAMHNGLVFMVMFLGPYFLFLADKERATAHES